MEISFNNKNNQNPVFFFLKKKKNVLISEKGGNIDPSMPLSSMFIRGA